MRLWESRHSPSFSAFILHLNMDIKKEQCLSKDLLCCVKFVFPTVQQEDEILYSAFRWANNTFTHFSKKEMREIINSTPPGKENHSNTHDLYDATDTWNHKMCEKQTDLYPLKRECVSQVRRDVFVLGAFIKMDLDPHKIISLAPLKLSALSVSCPNFKTYDCFKTGCLPIFYAPRDHPSET